MILTLEDWKKYPTAIVDDKTTNESFLKQVYVLKQMGVKNYYFFLALLQPELQGVDPHSENLTVDQKTKIAMECKYNPWYFFREVVRIPSGNAPLVFNLIRPLLAMLWCFFCGIDGAWEMPRQLGKSVCGDSLDIWLMYIYYDNTKISLLTLDDKLRKENIDRIKAMVKLIPPYLIPLTKKDADNMETITCIARGNILRTYVPQNNPDDANRSGRGHTVPKYRIDEVPFFKYIEHTLPALSGATHTVRENYEKEGVLHGCQYTTTSGELDNPDGMYVYSFFNGGCRFSEALYDAKDKYEARDIVKAGSSENRCLAYGVFSHRQCGKTDDWLREIWSSVTTTIDKFKRDYLLIWTRGKITGALDPELIDIICNSEREPVYVQIFPQKYIVRWYISEKEIASRLASGYFVMGLDTSNAMGKDANAFVILDMKDMSIIATSKVSEANLYTYGKWLASFLIQYKNITLVPENKMSGQAIIDTIAAKMIKENINPATRIYNRVVDEQFKYETEYNLVKSFVLTAAANIYEKVKGLFGFMTGSANNNRFFLYSIVLQDAVKSTGHLIKDSNLINELASLVVSKNGRVDHPVNGHDDLVIAWLIANWFVKYSKNLEFYGIDLNYCLSEVNKDGAILTEKELIDRKLLNKAKNEIELLKTEIKTAYTLTDKLRIEKQLEAKVKIVNSLGDNSINMNSIMEEIKANNLTRGKMKNIISKLRINKTGLLNLYKN